VDRQPGGADNRVELITAKLKVNNTYTKMSNANTAANDCAGAWQVAWRPVYAGSGWTVVRKQNLTEPMPWLTY
jgi:hypothetical protein